MASLTDLPLIEKARTQAQQLFDTDPDLQRPEDKLLGESLDRYWGRTSGDVS